MNKKAALLALLAFAAAGVQAEQNHITSAEYAECYDRVDLGAMKNSQWASCDEEELQRLDKKLNQIYGKVRGKIDANQKAKMTKGQKAWLDYRESWCRFREDAQILGMGYAAYTSCMVELTEQKIGELIEMAR